MSFLRMFLILITYCEASLTKIQSIHLRICAEKVELHVTVLFKKKAEVIKLNF
jgi:hypothetical protein